jgi:mRNA-degrading endonuclease RelE of RelBE toxin-antitoxin system
MAYEVYVSEPAEKEINKLDNYLIKRLHKRIQKLKTAPDVYGKPLRAPFAGIWEIRFEYRYRILYNIDYQKKRVIIVGFKHKNELAR